MSLKTGFTQIFSCYPKNQKGSVQIFWSKIQDFFQTFYQNINFFFQIKFLLSNIIIVYNMYIQTCWS